MNNQMGEVLLLFSSIYDKIEKLNAFNLNHSLHSIKIQLELIQFQLTEQQIQDLSMSNLRYIFEWCKICLNSLRVDYLTNQDDLKLFEDINQILLEILNQITKLWDQNYFVEQELLCITDECGNIINYEEGFDEFFGKKCQTIVNFKELIDCNITEQNLQNQLENEKQLIFYKLNYDVLKSQLSQSKTILQIQQEIKQDLQIYFNRYKLSVTIGNFEFTNNNDDKNQFIFYHPLSSISDENQMMKKLLILQFIKVQFQESQQLIKFVSDKQFQNIIKDFQSCNSEIENIEEE